MLNKLHIFIYISAFVHVLLVLYFFPKWTVDDAYITFRYAKNLAEYSQLTWNIGQEPIEGYTGLALPLILACCHIIGLSLNLASQVLGVFGFIIGGLFFFLLLRKWIKSSSLRSVIFLLYITAPFMATHAFSGLETTLFNAAVVCCLFVTSGYFSTELHRSRDEAALIPLAFVAGLIRPEGFVLGSLIILALFWSKLREKNRSWWPLTLKTALLFVLPLAAYLLWKHSYYGSLLPNSYTAKAFDYSLALPNAISLLTFFQEYLALPFLGGVSLWLLNLVSKRNSPTPSETNGFRPTYCVALLFILILCAQYLRTILVMNYSFRFFVPFFPILLVGAGVLIDSGLRIPDESDQKKPDGLSLARIILVLFFVIQLALYYFQIQKETTFAADYQKLIEEEHIPVGIFLKENVPADQWVSVYYDVGAISFYSDLPTIDFGGINDKLLADKLLTHKQMIDCLFARNPGALVFTSLKWEELSKDRLTAAVAEDQRLTNYRLARKFKTSSGKKYYQFCYLRNDLAGTLSH